MKAAWIDNQNPPRLPSVTAAGNTTIPLTSHLPRLFANGPRTYLISIASAGLLTAILWPVVEHALLLLWLSAHISISILRWLLAIHYTAASPAKEQAAEWQRYFLLGVCCAGLIWGSASVFLFPADSPNHQFLMILLLLGVTAIAAPALAVSRVAFLGFALPALVPLIVRLFSGSEPLSPALGGMCLLYLLLLIRLTQLREREYQQNASILSQNIDLQKRLKAAESKQQQLQDKVLAQEQRLRDFAETADILTGLANRKHLEKRLQTVLYKTQTLHTEHTLCFMDLDRFKIINNSYGHSAGDALLCQLAALLSDCLHEHDVLARLCSDEFALLLTDCKVDDASRIMRVLAQKVEKFQCHWQDYTFSTSMSVGIVPINQFTDSVQTLLSDAQSACDVAKKLGRNEIHVITANATERAWQQAEIGWLSRLEEALSKNQFSLHYQSIKPLFHDTGQTIAPHIEILLRLDDANGKPIAPSLFLPVAEKYGIAPRIDHWVINASLQWLQTFLSQRSDSTTDPLIAINLSGQSLSNLRLMHYIAERLRYYDIAPQLICFEITETAAIANLNNAVQFIQSLRRLGCQFALDDFGSGFSSYAYLKNLDVDFIKIDGSFITDIAANRLDKTMVQSIQDIAHALNKKTIAEQVEDDATLQILQHLGVDYIQGYHIDRPRPLSSLLPATDAQPTRPVLRAVAGTGLRL